MTPLDLAHEAVNAALDKKATRPVLLDLRGQSDLCDYQFVCSGESTKQVQTLASAIEEHCKKRGVRPYAVEGKDIGNWILMDYGSMIVHIFYNQVRDYYSVESLWPKAKFVKLNTQG